MVKQIRKRDGRLVRFNPEKINNAVSKAFIAQGKDDSLSVEVSELALEYINQKYKKTVPNVEQIQDEVERALIALNYPDVAKAYILYREERNKVRDRNTRLMKTF